MGNKHFEKGGEPETIYGGGCPEYNKEKPLSEKMITSFLMDNAKSMQKTLVQEIRDKFIEKKGDKIVWKQAFRVRLQEIEEVNARWHEAVLEEVKLISLLTLKHIGIDEFWERRKNIFGKF